MSDLEIQAGLGRSARAPRPAHPPRRGRRPRIGVAETLSGLFALFLVAAALAPALVAPGDPLGIDPLSAFQAPSLVHGFGTDESGRDIFTRVVHGTGSSLLIGTLATLIGLGLGLVLGTLAGMLGPVVDFTVNRLLEVLFAFPGLLLALLFILVFGPGVASATVAVGLATAPGYARIIRAQLVSVRSSAFVEAATVLGLGRGRILARHILPNTLAPLFVLGTLGIGQAIVWASALSYLGLGATPPAAEWGAMLSAGRTYIGSAWWMSFFPGLFIVLAAVSATALGRGIDRRLRHA
ncbi:ABC transporter permease [Cryobacterium sp. TMT1-21]|uniref:ABC transporter permease n=1 Tax=Cryobacterium shii TaxID=1259235 RepID=A0AAQ2HEY6_9MICO|nr:MULTISPECIES: ABC transporter permease [Cryobacterium]TFC43626.1 ABC transporter permease [Cryobacterium shii]TFC85998.1 ABC transporter permease [Cryobacterium sp. TmT2-59]TFD13739.1 ABC transporter permease [Cryobacterium sp. TMT4-10]TFD15896.1 ABC transporter permease [Cryobacterium sp. TMT1-21]TFD39841.1 ABC transporter permease [Cryobacterium sp. TMT2-10]